MKKTITIRIPEPCHEDWNQMTATEKGKFCDVCAKEVFDFTKMNDEELVKRVHNNEKLCGRFNASQLNREMKLERKSGISLAPLAASFLLPFTLLASTKTNSSNKNTALQGNSYTSLNIGSLNKVNFNKMQIITTGKITDENGKPISNVEIIVKETGKKELSGLKGDYKIASANDETLIFKKNGFIFQEVILKRESTIKDITLQKETINLENQLKGKMAICVPSYSRPVTKIDSILEKKKDSTQIVAKGVVTDEEGLPLPGVNIIIKGTTIGTQTDFDGNYELIVGKNQVLVFTYVGFATKEITLSNIDNYIDLKLDMSYELMGEMIIVGYTTYDDSNRLMGYQSSTYDPEPAPWKKEAQKAFDNEKEFSRIKRDRKKEARKQKRKSN